MDVVEVEQSDVVATITMNRPERRNAMNPALVEQILAAVQDVSCRPDVRVVVLRGAGGAFSVGGDLAEGAGGGVDIGNQAEAVAALRRVMGVSQLLMEMPQIVLAAIDGACAGAGLSLACACDLRIATRRAVFNTAFLSAGVSGDFGGSWTLPRIVGPAKARELYLLPGRFDAEEACRIGLVSEVVGEDRLEDRVQEICTRLAGSAPTALRAIKQNLTDALRLSLTETLDREADRHIQCALTQDAAEAARAFLEKRPARFQGR